MELLDPHDVFTAARAQPRLAAALADAERLAGKLLRIARKLPGRAQDAQDELDAWTIEAALAGLAPFEIVYVNDGSTDGTGAELARLAATRPHLRIVAHRESCGQSAAVRTGVRAARGAIVCTLDGDGQNDPAFIPAMASLLEASGPGCGLVQGQRVGRKDTGFKRFQSRVANNVRRFMLKDARQTQLLVGAGISCDCVRSSQQGQNCGGYREYCFGARRCHAKVYAA